MVPGASPSVGLTYPSPGAYGPGDETPAQAPSNSLGWPPRSHGPLPGVPSATNLSAANNSPGPRNADTTAGPVGAFYLPRRLLGPVLGMVGGER
jgi:hypothetical protein